ncbi:MAG: LCP family protein [Acidimicrobiales bacterium]
MRRPTRTIAIAGVVGGLIVGGVSVTVNRRPAADAVVVGMFHGATTIPLEAPQIVPDETTPPAGGGGLGGGGVVSLAPANGRPFRPAIPFNSSIAVAPGLRFVLVIGSDARPGESLERTRADSIHLIAVNPSTGQATIVGFPRDSWVELPGGRRAKINDALARGGPKLLADTVRSLTGLPVHYYVLTGFVGLQRMVDELGGVDVHVDRAMNDRFSGARFAKGWHHFTGGQALAFSRNRMDVPAGDFSRSQNQGLVILAALAKMRSEVADDADLGRWITVLRRHVVLDAPLSALPEMAALGRRIDPDRVTNLVLPGRLGTAGGGSVVLLGADANRIFVDLRDDAVIGNAQAAPAPTSSTTTSTVPSASASSSTSTSTSSTSTSTSTSTTVPVVP